MHELCFAPPVTAQCLQRCPYDMNSTIYRNTTDDFREAEHIRRFPQVVADRYQQLTVFHFTLSLPSGTPNNPFDSFQRHMQESLEQCACKRQQQGKPTPSAVASFDGAGDENGGIEIVILLNKQALQLQA